MPRQIFFLLLLRLRVFKRFETEVAVIACNDFELVSNGQDIDVLDIPVTIWTTEF